MESVLKSVEGVEDVVLDKMLAIGVISLADLAEVGTDPLVGELDLEETLAAKLVEIAAEAAKRIAAERAEAKKAEQEAKKAAEEAAAQLAAEGETDATTGDAAEGDAAVQTDSHAAPQTSEGSGETRRTEDSPVRAERREATIVADLAAGWRTEQGATPSPAANDADAAE